MILLQVKSGSQQKRQEVSVDIIYAFLVLRYRLHGLEKQVLISGALILVFI